MAVLKQVGNLPEMMEQFMIFVMAGSRWGIQSVNSEAWIGSSSQDLIVIALSVFQTSAWEMGWKAESDVPSKAGSGGHGSERVLSSLFLRRSTLEEKKDEKAEGSDDVGSVDGRGEDFVLPKRSFITENSSLDDFDSVILLIKKMSFSLGKQFFCLKS